MRTVLIAAIVLATPLAAMAQGQPGSTDAQVYGELITRTQERLNALGFDAGPPNGELNARTQAALAQLQLSLVIPAGGQLDDRTLAALGIERPRAEASAGPTAEPQPGS